VVPRLIVVADDNPDDLFFARRALEKAVAGAAVVTCQNGREVVELLQTLADEKKPAPRAVFLDIKMPTMDGFETLRWIRGQKHLAQLPVVMLSGSAEARDVELARTLGATDYLVKYPAAADFARVIGGAAASSPS
jgi:two-component system, response regulator